MTDSFSASYFSADAPGSRPCTVSLESRWLVVEPEEGAPVRWPYESLACEVAGDERAWITLTCREPGVPGIAAVVLRDHGLIAALADRVGEPCRGVLESFPAGKHAHGRRLVRGLVLFAIGMVAAVVAGWWSCTRFAPEVAADVMPVKTEMQLGRLLADGFLAGEQRLGPGPARDAVERIVDRLVAAADNPGYTFTVAVVDDPRVNALALPGGQIVVFTGLLAEAGSADEVAAVLAHEIQHVLHRHGLKRLVQQLGGAAVIALATGGGDLGQLATRAGELLQLSYGREQEAEADRDGLELLARAGLPPTAMATFFERLDRVAPGDGPEFLSTHPDTAWRIAEIRRRTAALPESPRRPLGIDWEAVRASLERR
jgi:Zn-dependent protease with chaperone function